MSKTKRPPLPKPKQYNFFNRAGGSDKLNHPDVDMTAENSKFSKRDLFCPLCNRIEWFPSKDLQSGACSCRACGGEFWLTKSTVSVDYFIARPLLTSGWAADAGYYKPASVGDK